MLLKWLQNRQNLVALAGVVIILWLGFSTARVIMRNYEWVQLIADLEQEIEILELENDNLRYQIDYYQTEAFLELEARDKLTLARPGENLLVLPDNRYDHLESSAELDNQPQIITNLNAWLDFLFGDKR